MSKNTKAVIGMVGLLLLLLFVIMGCKQKEIQKEVKLGTPEKVMTSLTPHFSKPVVKPAGDFEALHYKNADIEAEIILVVNQNNEIYEALFKAKHNSKYEQTYRTLMIKFMENIHDDDDLRAATLLGIAKNKNETFNQVASIGNAVERNMLIYNDKIIIHYMYKQPFYD